MPPTNEFPIVASTQCSLEGPLKTEALLLEFAHEVEAVFLFLTE
jgi:hypothetical protein